MAPSYSSMMIWHGVGSVAATSTITLYRNNEVVYGSGKHMVS
ncbi:uncharacterized protein G2W53_012629 [Senna tora]|uniref:Uncharacterized protein n=1 Tax=Senna tora TaxID=362788 RepID=A0A834U0X0_9FABA|nr:uncharacterized protein G2W53_012629 [Senna tora]